MIHTHETLKHMVDVDAIQYEHGDTSTSKIGQCCGFDMLHMHTYVHMHAYIALSRNFHKS